MSLPDDFNVFKIEAEHQLWVKRMERYYKVAWIIFVIVVAFRPILPWIKDWHLIFVAVELCVFWLGFPRYAKYRYQKKLSSF